MIRSQLTRVCAAALATSSLVVVPTAASAQVCQGGSIACLLPLSLPQAATVAVPPAAATPVAPAVAERGRFPILAVLGGLAVIGGILALVLSNDDNNDDDVVVPPPPPPPPTSP